MEQVLLDTNFIITCIKQKIDFFEEFYLMGIQIVIPQQVVNELEKLQKTVALNLLEKETGNYKIIQLKGKNVDNSIVAYSKENPATIIATLDKEMRRKIKNKKINIRNKKTLEII